MVYPFSKAASIGTTRSLETVYPDGNRDRVEYNQSTNLGIPEPPIRRKRAGRDGDHETSFSFTATPITGARRPAPTPTATTPRRRSTTGCTPRTCTITSGILESTKEPLEGRVWYDYAGQPSSHGSLVVGSTNKPTHVGRVLDDGTTQLYTYEYNLRQRHEDDRSGRAHVHLYLCGERH